jgi:hypothetical protein
MILPPDLKIEAFAWILSGNLMGIGICLVAARFLKARFHPRVIAQLRKKDAMGEHNHHRQRTRESALFAFNASHRAATAER